jgi:hypothetical protein
MEMAPFRYFRFWEQSGVVWIACDFTPLLRAGVDIPPAFA